MIFKLRQRSGHCERSAAISLKSDTYEIATSG